MRKFATLLVCVMALVCAATGNAYAKAPKSAFMGKWELTADTPIGIVTFVMHLSADNDQLTGLLTLADEEPTKDNTIEMEDISAEKENIVSFNFFSNGYDIQVVLESKKDGTCQGTMMGDFPVTGKKLK